MKASCLCGGVTYEITGPIQRARYCHCVHCRKFSGTAHAAWGLGLDRDGSSHGGAIERRDPIQFWQRPQGLLQLVWVPPVVRTHGSAAVSRHSTGRDR